MKPSLLLTKYAGHFISSCPTNGDPQYDFHKVKKPAGIPKCFLQPVTGGSSKATLMMPGGGYAVMVPNEYVTSRQYLFSLPSLWKCLNTFPAQLLKLRYRVEFHRAIGKKAEVEVDTTPRVEVPMEDVPQELQCPLCRNLLADAVLIPCCGNSFCDHCM